MRIPVVVPVLLSVFCLVQVGWAQKPKTTKVREEKTGKTLTLTYTGNRLTVSQIDKIFNVIYPPPLPPPPPDPLYHVYIDGIERLFALNAGGVVYVPLREFIEKSGMSLSVSRIDNVNVNLYVVVPVKVDAVAPVLASLPPSSAPPEVDLADVKETAYAEGFLAGQNAAVAGTSQTAQVVESRIDGDFEGWDGDTIFKLYNGQVWQQTDFAYHYHYSFMPDVVIYPSGRVWKMRVEGVKKAITVTRLK